MKSRIVLKILKLGYNVLLSDVDTYWFRNPIPLLHSFGRTVLVAQSDEYQEQGADSTNSVNKLFWMPFLQFFFSYKDCYATFFSL